MNHNMGIFLMKVNKADLALLWQPNDKNQVVTVNNKYVM